MAEQSKLPNALKHGAYCKNGALEHDIVTTLTRLIWRKQNLSTYDLAREARERVAIIRHAAGPKWVPSSPEARRADEQIKAAQEAAEDLAEKELAEHWELIELGNVVTPDYLLKELSVVDRLDGMIDKCLKRLLMVRGVKSMTIHPSDAKALTAPAADRSR